MYSDFGPSGICPLPPPQKKKTAPLIGPLLSGSKQNRNLSDYEFLTTEFLYSVHFHNFLMGYSGMPGLKRNQGYRGTLIKII